MEFEKFEEINSCGITSSQALNHNVLVFAFVGDAVFTLYVREYLASHSTKKAGVLHTETSKYVKASFQAELLDILMPLLAEKEKQIALSARNIKTHNIAKHSTAPEYKKATSIESVLGYLYMTKQSKRLAEILQICKEYIKQTEEGVKWKLKEKMQ